MSGAKRFSDREEIGALFALAETLEPGDEAGEPHRTAGRVLGRRDLGQLVFLDLVDRSGSIQLLCRVDRVGKLDVDLGDIVGVVGSLTKTRRGEPSLEVSELTLLSKIRRPLPDHFHGLRDTETRYRQRYLDLLMSEETRGGLSAPRPARHRAPAISRRKWVR